MDHLVRVHVDMFSYKFIENEDFDDMTFELAENFSIFGGSNRLQKRDGAEASQLPVPVVVQFDVGSKHFVLRLRQHPNILTEETVIREHYEGKGAVSTRSVNGSAFVGDKLVVIDRNLADHKFGSNATSLIELTEQPGVSVIGNPFGRFFIDQSSTGESVNGGFAFEKKFIRVQNVAHPTARRALSTAGKKMNVRSGPAKNASSLIASIQNLEDVSSFGKDRNSTRRYRCGHDHLKYNRHPDGAASFFANLLGKGRVNDGKDDNSFNKKLYARTDSGCPSDDMVMYIGVVADCGYLEAFKMDAAQAQANIINDFNLVSSIYEEAFNVNLGIISIDLLMDCSGSTSAMEFNRPCSNRIKMDEKLSLFTKWRGSQSADAGIYHLVSGCNDADIVGIAWLNQVCQAKPYVDSNGDSVAGTSVSVFIKNQFAIMAHEIGHNFGAVHDCDAETCKTCSGSDCQCCTCGECDCRAQFVMNPESGGLNVKKFSPCTINDVCQKMPVLASCLKPPGTLKTIAKAMCGNGIRDEGEECDCGGPEKCAKDACCTEDCKLKKGAVCSDENDRCCRNCQLIKAEERHVCIPSKSICQIQSVCDGTSRDCPKVQLASDGTKCDDKGGKCASGVCTSRSKQCAAVGARLGLTEECPYEFSSCSIVCKSGNSCVMLDATFVNGTSCGYDGRCYGGVCSEPAYQTFVMRNIVPLGIIVGSLILIGIFILGNTLIGIFRGRR